LASSDVSLKKTQSTALISSEQNSGVSFVKSTTDKVETEEIQADDTNTR